MTSHRDDVVDALNQLIETCRDGEAGFREAAEGVQDANLARLFRSYSAQRAQFVAELDAQVRRLGGDPAQRGHAAASAHRGWMNLRHALTGGSDAAVVAEAERGEDHAVRAYEKALEADLPEDLRLIVERQYMEVREAHDHVRSLERSQTERR